MGTSGEPGSGGRQVSLVVETSGEPGSGDDR